MLSPQKDLSSLSMGELRQIAAAEAEMNRRLKQDKLSLYVPLQKVLPFHQSTAQTRCLSGGNRSSKTTTGVIEDIYHCTGKYPDWYPKENRRPRPVKLRIVVPDFKEGCLDVIEPKFQEWCPGFDDFPKRRDKTTGAMTKMWFPDGSILDVLTHAQKTNVHEGKDLDIVHFDEPCPYDKYIANIRGLVDRGGLCYMTFTLLNEPWIIEKLYDPWLDGDKDIAFFNVEMDDNVYLTPENIEMFCKFMDEQEIETRRKGKFGRLEGRIFKKFDGKAHVVSISGPEAIPPHFTRVMVCDPHDSRPHYFGWCAISPPAPVSFYIWYRTLILGDLTVPEMAARILEEERLYSEKIYLRIIDPNFGNKKSSQTGTTFVQDYATAGVSFKNDVNDNLATGHVLVKQLLNYDTERLMDGTNYPRMYFASYLTQMIRSMRNYAYAPGADGKPVLVGEAKPDKKWKDMADLVRYLAASGVTYVDTKSEQKVIPIRRNTRYNLGGY